jgi:hypothetical protein
MNYSNSYSIRIFDGWGGVYRQDEKVFEGRQDECYDYVLDQSGVAVEKDDSFIANEGQAAPTLTEAKRYDALKQAQSG